MIYKVIVDQTYSETYRTLFEVEANSEEEALKNYYEGEIIDYECTDSSYNIKKQIK